MPLTFEIVHTCVYIQNTNDHEELSDSHKYFTFVSQYLFLNTYDLFIIPHFTVIFVFAAMKFLLQFINILHLPDILALSH